MKHRSMRPLLDLHQADTAESLAEHLADFVRAGLLETLKHQEKALLVVSGGSTPVLFFEALRQRQLPWSRIVVTLADERWVPPIHPDSNEGLVRKHLLQGDAAQALFMPWWRDWINVHEAESKVRGELDALPWPASVVVLGMGGDGHTASLFPHDASWRSDVAQHHRCIAVPAPLPPNVPVPRLSLTPRAIVDAETVVVHLTGEAKWDLLHHAQQEGPPQDYPIRLAWQQRHAPCHIFYAD